jgi:hypothetical protein
LVIHAFYDGLTSPYAQGLKTSLFIEKVIILWTSPKICGKASDAIDAVRSTIPTGFTFLRINLGKIQ